MRLIFITLAAALSAPATAQLYDCSEGSGKLSYTSKPTGEHCVLVKSYEPAAPAAATPPTPTAPPRQANTPPAAKPIPPRERPVVSAATQKERDKKRAEILQYELERETAIYVRVRDALLAEQEKPQQDTQYIALLTQWRRIRAQNIKAIRQELARL